MPGSWIFFRLFFPELGRADTAAFVPFRVLKHPCAMGAVLSALGVDSSAGLPADLVALAASCLEGDAKASNLKSQLESLADEAEESGRTVQYAEAKAVYDEACRAGASSEAILEVAKLVGRRQRAYHGMLPMLTRKPAEPFESALGFEPSLKNVGELAKCKVLCVGAGGLGCEILKNLALSGVKNITTIDLDTIDISNLNRQFLFRMKDVGKPKAQVAAEFIESRCRGVRVKWFDKKIQEFDDEFYRQFDLVIAGLDNVKARLWLNAKLYSLITYDEDGDPELDSIIPLVDGGTEGFKGQARFFFGPYTSCFECSAAQIKDGPKFELCTIASVPRRAEHCIAYAMLMLWPRLEAFTDHKRYEMTKVQSEGSAPTGAGGAIKLDKDNPEHMTWLYERAKERAGEFKIAGVTYNLTMQFVKNIIPAIASTNALVSAACTNEALKFLSKASPNFNNYFFYNGQSGAYSRTFEYKKNPDCPTCGELKISFTCDGSTKLSGLMAELDEKYRFTCVGISSSDGTMVYSKGLHSTFAANLEKPVSEVFQNGQNVIVTAQKPGDAKAKTASVMLSFS